MLNVYLIILIPLVLLLIGGVVVLIIFLVRKKKINKKLEEDKENIENGKPITGKKIKGPSSEELVHLTLCLLIIITCTYFLTVCNKIDNLRYLMQSDYSSLNSSINSIKSNLEDVVEEKLDEFYQSQSIIVSFTVKNMDETFDQETNTERLKISIIPRELSSDTTLSLTIDGQTYDAERNENTFEIIYNKNIFKWIYNKIYVNITSNGITKIEEINDEDFYYADNILEYSWECYFSSMANVEAGTGKVSLKDGCLKIDNSYKFNIWENNDGNDIESFNVKLIDNEKIIYEQKNLAYSDYQDEDGDVWEEKRTYSLSIDETFKNIQSDTVYMVAEIVTVDGYVITEYYEESVRTTDNYHYVDLRNRIITHNGEIVYKLRDID